NPRDLEPDELVDVAKESADVEYDGAGLIVLSISKELTSEGRVSTITLAKMRFGTALHIEARYVGRSGEWIDLGLVVETPANSERTAAVRDAITRVLERVGPASKNKIAKEVGRNRNAVMSEIDVMLGRDVGLLIYIGNKVGLPKHLPLTPTQTDLAQVV